MLVGKLGMNNRYLYWYSGLSISRAKVIRETDFNIWIKYGARDTRISKKTYRLDNGYCSSIYFYEETDGLKNKYELQEFHYKFKKSLRVLENCTDTSIMTDIIDIANKFRSLK